MKVTAGLIIRNEAARYLGMAVENLLGFVDEIAVVDDGSSDGWLEELSPGWGGEAHRIRVLRLDDPGRDIRPDFHRHAVARNRLLQFTLETNPTWVVASDADELFTDGQAIRRLCETTHADVVGVNIAEVWEACDDVLCTREDGGWRTHPIGCVWRADKFRSQALALADKGHATGRVPDAVHRVPADASGEALLHFGWTNQPERAVRFRRYDEGDDGKFHARAHIDSIMWTGKQVNLQARPWPQGWPPSLRDRVRERANRK